MRETALIVAVFLAASVGCTGSKGAPSRIDNPDASTPRPDMGIPRTPTPCTDGVDCYCDRVNDPNDPLYDPNLLACDDFEDPVIEQPGGWFDTYGPAATACYTGNDYTNTEGEEIDKCVNVVHEGQCDIDDSDCVLDGNRAMGQKFRPARATLGFGGISFPQSTTIGFAYAVKYSANYFDQGAPQKTDEFGENGYEYCLLGCNTTAYSRYFSTDPDTSETFDFETPTLFRPSQGLPGGQFVFVTNGCGDGSCFGNRIEGGQSASSVGYMNHSSDTEYNQKRDWPLGTWGCQRFHVEGWGTNNAHYRYWFNDQLLIDIEGIDMTGINTAKDGLKWYGFNNYYNGRDEIHNDYEGSTLAYRFEDNIHITSGPEAPTCAQIGVN